MYELIEKADELVKTFLEENEAIEVNPKDVNLDPKSGATLHVCGDFIAVKTSSTSFEYYSGFDYVDGEHRLNMGKWKIYSANCERVRDVIEAAYDNGYRI